MAARRAIIIGGGPAGLTAAYELATRTDIQPIVLEADTILGGISRTVNYKGNRIDIGGHRFFSKSDRVMDWWFDKLPMEALEASQVQITYQQKERAVGTAGDGPTPDETDDVMLLRPRKSRVYYLRRFFDYPISLSGDTLKKLGPVRVLKIGISYCWSTVRPIRPEKTLEQFFINRFGKELYLTFFKSYTEKVWGVPCHEIPADWGAQRIKGLSMGKTVMTALRKMFRKGSQDARQKDTETSLIEQFFYPKHGPGQMWEHVAEQVKAHGGEIVMQQKAVRIGVDGDRITSVMAQGPDGTETEYVGDFFFSTMPVKDLVAAMQTTPPPAAAEVAANLSYRDFVTVGLLLSDLKIREQHQQAGELIRDNWIYIQEPDVLVGRLQIFNNWSQYMVANPGQVWIGLEYFCNEGDGLWTRSDEAMVQLGTEEMARIGIIDESAVLDSTVVRMPKTYPSYIGAYERFDEVRGWLDTFPNLFLIGRNGMHRYNNQDHSMLTAMVSVDNILAGRTDKANIWAVNTEEEYHEEGSSGQDAGGEDGKRT